MTHVEGKVAIVTGGSRGIGLAIAGALVDRGARVVVTGTTEGPLGVAMRELEAKRAASALAIRADVRRYEEVERVMDAAVATFGGIDILVNNAGIGIWRPVSDMSVEEWQRIIDTNLSGTFYCSRAVLPHLRARGAGWIINISSLASENPLADGAAYCASKAGLNAFSESLMQEVRHQGIRVAYVMPGSVRTDFGGNARGNDDWKLAPDDVAQVVVDLLEHPAHSLPSRVELRPAKPPKKG